MVARVVGGMPVNRKSNTWSGYFYRVVVPKVGRVFSSGNRKPFKDFLVDSKWIFNLLQAGKLTTQHARELALKVCNNSRRSLDELAMLDKEEERVAIVTARKRAEDMLRARCRPFRTIPAVTQ